MRSRPIYPGVIQVPFGGAQQLRSMMTQTTSTLATEELVITKPVPMMPLGSLGDPDRSRLLDTYFNHYPGKTIWYHADHSKRLAAASDWI
jgi:acyl-coenzyme A synthetase/AMP-(fatty) acid ligase